MFKEDEFCRRIIESNFGLVTEIKKYDYDSVYLDLHLGTVISSKSVKKDPEHLYLFSIRGEFRVYPISIALHGLEQFSKFIVTRNERFLNEALIVADYLVNAQHENGGWPVSFEYQYGVLETEELQPGWNSALTQGFVISLLVRVYKQTSDEKYIKCAYKATKLFEQDVSKGGVRDVLFDKFPIYVEYPTSPGTFILNGFIFSIIGLYDLWSLSKDTNILELYQCGLESLKKILTMYDLNHISSYDLSHVTIPGNKPKIHEGYHLTHIKQLTLLYRVTGEMLFKNVADRWITYAQGNKGSLRLNSKFIEINVERIYEGEDLTAYVTSNYVDKSVNSSFLEYAYYLYRNGEVIQKVVYGKENSCQFKLDSKGLYKVCCFVCDEFENRVLAFSEVINTYELSIANAILTYDDGKLLAKVVLENNIYATSFSFYLFRNGVVLEKIFYRTENEYAFKIQAEGEYQVLCFAHNDEKKASLYTNKVEVTGISYHKPCRICILGSCVTRDIFEIAKPNRFEIESYFARSSLQSIFSKPRELNENKLNLKSKFQKEKVLEDFSSSFVEVDFNGVNYIIIDLIDERFQVVTFANGSKVTMSNELIASGYLSTFKEGSDYIIQRNNIESWKVYCEKFAEYTKIKDIQNKIVLHEAYWKESYISKEGEIVAFSEMEIEGIRKQNLFLSQLYSVFKALLPKAQVICIESEFSADEKHNWGLAPYHYEKNYYFEALKKLNELERS